jgi:hypothetical protein
VEESAESREEGQAGPPGRLTHDDRRATAVELLASIAVALWLSRSFWLPGRYVVAFDTVAYSGPNFEVTMESWRAGRLPLLNEYIFGSAVHLGNAQAGALYPPKVIGLFFDTNRAMGVLVASHLVLLAVGMVLLVRRLGCRPPARFAAALVVCGNGAVLTRTVQFEQILVLAWLPLLLLGIAAVLEADERPFLPMTGTAAVTTLLLLAGHPQIVYQVVFVAIFWAAALTFLHRSWRRVADLAIAVAIGAAVAAPQLLAAIAAKRDSSLGFGRTLPELRSPELSAQPGRIVQILLGSFRHVNEAVFAGGFESIGHVGVAAAFLAVFGIGTALRDPRRRPLAIAVGMVAVIGVVWALGPRTRLFTAARRWLPGFDLVRGSARWLDVTAFCVALGVAWGVDALAKSSATSTAPGTSTAPTSTWWSVLPVVAGAGLLVLAMGLGAFGASDLPDGWTVASWLAVAMCVIAALLLARRADGSAVVALLVVVLVALELGALSRFSVIDATTTSMAFDDLSPGIAGELRDRPGLTVAFTDDDLGNTAYLVAGFRPNTNVLAKVRSLDGYDGGVQITDRFQALLASQKPVTDPNLPLRNHLPASWQPSDAAAIGVRWVLIDTRRDAATQLPGWQRTELAGGGFDVWENPAWVGDAVGRRPDGTEVGLGVDRRSPTELVVAVTDPSPMRLTVYRQTAPGWRVRVDGRSADIVDDGFFLAVDVPAGTNTVEFSYEPRWLKPSLVLASTGFAAILALAIAGRLRPAQLKPRL